MAEPKHLYSGWDGTCPACNVRSDSWEGSYRVGIINSFGAFPVTRELIAVTCPSCGAKFTAEENL